GRKPNTTIQELEKQLADAEADQASTKKRLAKLIADQQKRVVKFAERFNVLVQQTLTKLHKGVVEIDEEGIDFQILRGESLSGEANETLAIFVGDLALLFESQADHSHPPGLLIHDSPREADLYEGIYRRMLNMVEEQMQSHRKQGEVPFQYIVTTTT